MKRGKFVRWSTRLVCANRILVSTKDTLKPTTPKKNWTMCKFIDVSSFWTYDDYERWKDANLLNNLFFERVREHDEVKVNDREKCQMSSGLLLFQLWLFSINENSCKTREWDFTFHLHFLFNPIINEIVEKFSLHHFLLSKNIYILELK